MFHSRNFIAFFLVFSSSLFADQSQINKNDGKPIEISQILYLLQANETSQAISLYKTLKIKSGIHDLELIQRMGLSILDQGSRSSNPEIQLLTLFGAGVAYDEKILYILEEGLSSPIPQLQLIAMNFLARYQNDDSDIALTRAMGSNHLLIRLEAAWQLASKKYPTASSQIESLMFKVDKELYPLFPQFFAKIGSASSIKVLRKLLADSDEKVRIAAILSSAEFKRDDMLPQLRQLASQHGHAQQEACAFALGKLMDERSIPRLEEFARSPNVNVQLAAYSSLYALGKHEVREKVAFLAKNQNVFAAYLLGNMPGCENTLAELSKSTNLQLKINSALSLLKLRDPRCLLGISEVLIKDSRDLVFIEIDSPGKALEAWKVVPSAKQYFEDDPAVFELSLNLKEEVLQNTLHLPEQHFLKLAETLLQINQNELIPLLVDQLETLGTPEAIEILKKYQQKAGAPLIRNYCNLALYRLKIPGPYGDNLRKWITQQQNGDLINFRPFLPWEMREKGGTYQLTPYETSKLLIESFETFAKMHDDQIVEVFLEAIQNGNIKNKYVLAGLLIRIAQ